MTDLITDLLASVQGSSVLIDTNLLLLYLVGSYDPDRISRFKRTSQFVAEDFSTLSAVLGRFRSMLTTPHVLAETSNLLGQLSGQVRDECFARFAAAVDVFGEVHQEGRGLVQNPAFLRLGLTDTGILELAARKCLVLTDDFLLYSFLEKAGAIVLNFNHIRVLNWR
jgi:hypothetical protein